jgi:hypothetical protein
MTDSELEKRWDAYRLNKGSMNAADEAHERLAIKREWEAIVKRKSYGELTDPAKTTAVESVIRDEVKLLGVPVRVEVRKASEISASDPGEDDWLITAYLTPTRDVPWEKMSSLYRKITDALVTQGAIEEKYMAMQSTPEPVEKEFSIGYFVTASTWAGPR